MDGHQGEAGKVPSTQNLRSLSHKGDASANLEGKGRV